MTSFHKTAKKNNQETTDDGSHLNFMGGVSYDITNPILKLRVAASSCFFGEPKYYQDEDSGKQKKTAQYISRIDVSQTQIDYLCNTLCFIGSNDWKNKNPSQVLETAIDAALDFDVNLTLREAARIRNEEHIRVTPQVILVRAANHKKQKGTGLVTLHAPNIIKRGDEPAIGLAYHIHTYGKDAPIPNSLKKAWKEYLQKLNDYSLAKYKMDNKEVKTIDVVNLVHPKSDSINKLMKGQLSLVDDDGNGKTWEALISAKGSSKETWTEAIDKMGHMALLRNCRNLLDNGVDANLFIDRLVSGAEKGQQLPFRYYSAYKAIESAGHTNPKLLDAIEECMKLSMCNVPKFNGKVMSLCDNSGSAQGATTSSLGTMKVSTIGNLTGIITGMNSDEGYLGVFGDNLRAMSVRKQASVFDQLKQAEELASTIGMSTEQGIWLFWNKAIQEKQHWDYVFVYSDLQAGHGKLYGTTVDKKYQWGEGSYYRFVDVPKLISAYRKTVNPNVMVFSCQIAGYTDTIIPEWYDRSYLLGGWGDGILKFAAEMTRIVNLK